MKGEPGKAPVLKRWSPPLLYQKQKFIKGNSNFSQITNLKYIKIVIQATSKIELSLKIIIKKTKKTLGKAKLVKYNETKFKQKFIRMRREKQEGNLTFATIRWKVISSSSIRSFPFPFHFLSAIKFNAHKYKYKH